MCLDKRQLSQKALQVPTKVPQQHQIALLDFSAWLTMNSAPVTATFTARVLRTSKAAPAGARPHCRASLHHHRSLIIFLCTLLGPRGIPAMRMCLTMICHPRADAQALWQRQSLNPAPHVGLAAVSSVVMCTPTEGIDCCCCS